MGIGRWSADLRVVAETLRVLTATSEALGVRTSSTRQTVMNVRRRVKRFVLTDLLRAQWITAMMMQIHLQAENCLQLLHADETCNQ